MEKEKQTEMAQKYWGKPQDGKGQPQHMQTLTGGGPL